MYELSHTNALMSNSGYLAWIIIV